MYTIKCKDFSVSDSIHFSTRWSSFVVSYDSLESAMRAVERQKKTPKKCPHIMRKYRIFYKEGRTQTLVWED